MVITHFLQLSNVRLATVTVVLAWIETDQRSNPRHEGKPCTTRGDAEAEVPDGGQWALNVGNLGDSRAVLCAGRAQKFGGCSVNFPASLTKLA